MATAVPPVDLSKVTAGAPRASTPPPGKTKPALSSSKRSASADKKKKEDLPLTPRARKATKQLFKELGHVRHTTIHMKKRVDATLCIVDGVQAELILAAEGVRKRLDQNKVMTMMTKPTRAGAGLAPPVKTPSQPKSIRRPNEYETKCIADELKPDGDANPDELEEAIAKQMELKQQAGEILRTMTGQTNTPIVEALEKLEQSATLLAKELVPHQEVLRNHVMSLTDMIESLRQHEQMRDDLFDPVKTNEKIKRSVLYQKMSPLAPLPLDLQDKDQAATAGRISFGTTGPVTGHEATFMAAEKEDTGRADCAKAMKCVRSCQQELALRKSQLQVSVLNQRAAVLKARRAAKTGKFGSSEDRDTTPGSGGAKHKNPEDAKE